MNSFSDLGQWWNLIFIVPFGLGVVLVLLSVLGAGRHGMSHAGHGVGHGGSHLGGHALAPGNPAAGGHALTQGHAASGSHVAHTGQAAHGQHGHATHAQDSHAQHGQAHGAGRATDDSAHQAISQPTGQPASGAAGSHISILHLENIPPLMLAQNFLLFWGICGWTANRLLAKGMPDPGRFIVPSLLAATCASLVLTVLLSATLARFTPSDATSVVMKRDLEGRLGEAVSPITERVGAAYVRDAFGTLHHLPSRIQPEGAPIARGEPIVVIEYDSTGDYYRVKKWDPATQGNDV